MVDLSLFHQINLNRMYKGKKVQYSTTTIRQYMRQEMKLTVGYIEKNDF